MTLVSKNLNNIKATIPEHVTLVAVSKTKPHESIMDAYNAGQRIFGENKIQEMAEKWEALPKDIEWHMIGHVQRNKVKYMASFVSLIHGVDNAKLLQEINKQAAKHNRVIDCLLQIKIADEDSKFGMTKEEAIEILSSAAFQEMKHVNIVGLMGMATFTNDHDQVASEFETLKTIQEAIVKTHPEITTVSMGMSGDYELAIEKGSTMVRIGSSIFGARQYSNA